MNQKLITDHKEISLLFDHLLKNNKSNNLLAHKIISNSSHNFTRDLLIY